MMHSFDKKFISTISCSKFIKQQEGEKASYSNHKIIPCCLFCMHVNACYCPPEVAQCGDEWNKKKKEHIYSMCTYLFLYIQNFFYAWNCVKQGTTLSNITFILYTTALFPFPGVYGRN
jgi:hypothetical protein